MNSDTPSPPLSLSITPTQSWTQDSTIDVDDVQHQIQTQSEAPGSSTVFEKKWIVTEVGDNGTSLPSFAIAHRLLNLPSPSSRSGEFGFPTCPCAPGVSISHYLSNQRRYLVTFFFRMASKRTASFSEIPISIPVRRRRQRKVRIVCVVCGTRIVNPHVSPFFLLWRIPPRRLSSCLASLPLPFTRVGG
jgi:hypothetical protein